MDQFSQATRSWIMSRVASSDTSAEVAVRSILHRMGYRFRLHCRNLPGKPDIVLPKHRAVVFVHGCFWHRHARCKRATVPASNRTYWLPKFRRTVARDRTNRRLLRRLGWNVVIVWECELTKPDSLATRLAKRIGTKRDYPAQGR
ncbi:MAG TPA: DNA mismatch endonuclease Vsr [Candidatus Hydrogenedentes bacterium]|nr:DNA mismatch endonuclease Vsr [Candidatus Hydrogenedentota bacterium]HQM48709.1 DNA mismatch endonuclease Vsr [Candidatus Hydrogenedentota bacterium]